MSAPGDALLRAVIELQAACVAAGLSEPVGVVLKGDEAANAIALVSESYPSLVWFGGQHREASIHGCRLIFERQIRTREDMQGQGQSHS